MTITPRSVFREITWAKNTFGLDVAKDAMPVSYFPLDYLMRRGNDSLSAWYSLRVN